MTVAAKAICIHLGLVAGCFVVSCPVAVASCPFAGPHTGDVLFGMLGFVLAGHVVAGVIALCLRRVSLLSVLILAVICLLPAGLFTYHAVADAIYTRYYAVWDRFRDHLADPVPKSVTNLRFTTLDEMINPDLSFRFDIDPNDLREIVRSKGLKLVKPEELICPNDYFKFPYYLPMQGLYVLYQGREKYGEVVTLKVNEAHDRAIFRLESQYCPWQGNATIVADGNEQLEKMKVNWETQHPGQIQVHRDADKK